MEGRTNGPIHHISTLQATILLYHLVKGAEVKEVGFEDLDHTMGELRTGLERRIPIPRSVLESCLWSCNLMGEINQFWHPDKKKYKDFIAEFAGPGEEFDLLYNLFKKKGSK